MDGAPRIVGQDERLAKARQALNSAHATLQSGKPVQALQELLRITRSLGGDDGPLLTRAIEALSQGNNSGTQDLARLLEQCNLNLAPHEAPGEQAMPQAEDVSMDHNYREASSGESVPSIQPDPILAETGRGGITGAALDDDSSFICRDCGGVVSRNREEAHREIWCSSAKRG